MQKLKNVVHSLNRAIRQPVYWIDAKFGPAAGDRYMAAIRPLRKALSKLGA